MSQGKTVILFYEFLARIRRMKRVICDDEFDRLTIGPGQYRPGKRWHKKQARRYRKYHRDRKSFQNSVTCYLILYFGISLGIVTAALYFGLPWIKQLTISDLQEQLENLRPLCEKGFLKVNWRFLIGDF